MKRILLYIHAILVLSSGVTCQTRFAGKENRDQEGEAKQTDPGVWQADRGDGTYRNPVLHADYSDPDVIRVGDDFYMTASSFNCVPGLPLLHSKDLVNWNLVGHALPLLSPAEVFNTSQHGGGVWAPCLRYHNNEFYIFYPDPDRGIYLVRSSSIAGPWSEPRLVMAGEGLIDPSPLWDDDGNAYLVFAFAGSRAGVKSVLIVCKMDPASCRVTGNGVMVFDGHPAHPTVEGPKFYKRNGYYYIFAPAGGVKYGWQLVLRSKNVFGPYEERIVLAQENTSVNGPHQGAWVNTHTGEDWFIHFQDKGPYGRVVHLQPMQWVDDWPVIGTDSDNDGIGEPVTSFRKPDVAMVYPVATPPESDEFNGPTPGLQWQWHANPSVTWGYPAGLMGFYRLNCIARPDHYRNLWDVPNLFLQKLPAEAFTATASVIFHPRAEGDEAGMVMMGQDYRYISLLRAGEKLFVRVVQCTGANKGTEEKIIYSEEIQEPELYLRVKVESGASCSFSYSTDGRQFITCGEVFNASPGMWIGAKTGFFALSNGFVNDAGGLDIDWFRIEKNNEDNK